MPWFSFFFLILFTFNSTRAVLSFLSSFLMFGKVSTYYLPFFFWHWEPQHTSPSHWWSRRPPQLHAHTQVIEAIVLAAQHLRADLPGWPAKGREAERTIAPVGSAPDWSLGPASDRQRPAPHPQSTDGTCYVCLFVTQQLCTVADWHTVHSTGHVLHHAMSPISLNHFPHTPKNLLEKKKKDVL